MGTNNRKCFASTGLYRERIRLLSILTQFLFSLNSISLSLAGPASQDDEEESEVGGWRERERREFHCLGSNENALKKICVNNSFSSIMKQKQEHKAISGAKNKKKNDDCKNAYSLARIVKIHNTNTNERVRILFQDTLYR